MDLAEFFGSKERPPIKLHPPARNYSTLSDGSICGSVTNMSIWSTKAVVSGTDYAEAYIKAEEKNLLEVCVLEIIEIKNILIYARDFML